MNRRSLFKTLFGTALASTVKAEALPIRTIPYPSDDVAFSASNYVGEMMWMNMNMPRWEFVDGKYVPISKPIQNT
jgi:hypothetical protein